MTRKTKLTLGVLLAAAGATGGYYGYDYYYNSDIVVVQAGEVVRQDLNQTVASTGEIKPKKSVNISSNAMGRIVRMPVKEGDRVREGDLLIALESIQTAADVEAAQATLAAAETELDAFDSQIKSNEAAILSAKAEIARAETDMNRARLNLERAEASIKDGLIPREQYEHTKADHEVAVAQLNAARARLVQAEAQAVQTLKQRQGTSLRLAQHRTSLIRARDQLEKTTINSPLTGIITSLPVNVGEIAIIGVQNQPGTTLMTIADMSVITAEVKVDETDIVNLRLGQEAEVKVDALGDRILKGHVSDVGNSAVNRSGNNNAGTQEAKDFKVVITLDEPPPELRPGLSCTARIITARTSQVLTIPIQALTVREFDDPEDPLKRKKIEKEGVFVINAKGDSAVFRAVKTGITGTTDIEILDGLSEKERIVTGPYQVLRTLEDNKRFKIEEPQD